MNDRECKSSTLDELIEKRKMLQCFVTRAEHMRSQLKRATAGVDIALELSASSLNRTEFQRPVEDSWPSFSDVTTIHDDIYDTMERILELEDRLRKWGAID